MRILIIDFYFIVPVKKSCHMAQILRCFVISVGGGVNTMEGIGV